MFLPPWLWKFIRSRRTRVTLVCLPFGLLAAGASFYGYANWKGERDVERHLARMKSLGYSTSPEEYFLPSENPDDDMLRHPAILAEFARPDHLRLSRLVGGSTTPVKNRYKLRLPALAARVRDPFRHLAEREDAKLYFDPPRHETETEAAREILAALAPERERALHLNDAIARPEAVWRPVTKYEESYKYSSFGDLHKLNDLAGFKKQIAVLHLAAGEPDEAHVATMSLIRLNRHFLGTHVTFVHCLMAGVNLHQVEQLVYEGISRGIWTDAMLADIEYQISQIDPQKAIIRAFPAEVSLQADHFHNINLALSDQEIHLTEGWNMDLKNPGDMGQWNLERLRELCEVLHPNGLNLSESVMVAERIKKYVLTKEGESRARFDLADLPLLKQLEADSSKKIGVDTGLFAPDEGCWDTLRLLSYQALAIEAKLALLRTGVALERHRLRHRQHPEFLQALVPQFLSELPIDPYDGKPLRYRLQPDGSPWVWSVGQNGKDEGGLPHQRNEKGDLIWITRPIPGFSDADFKRK